LDISLLQNHCAALNRGYFVSPFHRLELRAQGGFSHRVHATLAIMKISKLHIPEVLLIEPRVFEDERGFFFESFNGKRLRS
jgi:hypothetical protein